MKEFRDAIGALQTQEPISPAELDDLHYAMKLLEAAKPDCIVIL
jgi:hypothetical protein